MVGSATLDWPTDPEKELGTKILLIDKFAKDPDQAINFSHTFDYTANAYGQPSEHGAADDRASRARLHRLR